MKLKTQYLYTQPEMSELQNKLLVEALRAFGLNQYDLMYKKLVACKPEPFQFLQKNFLYALYFRSQKKYQLAIDSYLRALTYNAKDIRLLNNLSIIYCLNSQFEEGLKTINQAIELFPQISFLTFQKGTCLYKLNRMSEAETIFRKCLRQERPMLIEFLAQAKISELRYNEGNINEAMSIYRRLSQLPSQKGHTLLQQSRRALMQNDWEKSGNLLLMFFLHYNFEKIMPAEQAFVLRIKDVLFRTIQQFKERYWGGSLRADFDA